MIANQSSHLWLTRYCVQLMRLQPGINVRSAVRRAVAAYPYTDHLQPEDAALRFESDPSIDAPGRAFG